MGSPEEKAILKKMFYTNRNWGHIQRGNYNINGKEMYFRSKAEANYALYLDWLQKEGEIEKWEYEPDIFTFDAIKYGTRQYTPDFKILTRGIIRYDEVKGFMDSKSRTKLKRMAKYYPEVAIVIIDSKCYNDIKKKVGKLCKFY